MLGCDCPGIIHNWLSKPQSDSCCSINAKKAVLLAIAFGTITVTSHIEHHFIGFCDMPLAAEFHWFAYYVTMVAIFFATIGLFDNKPGYFLPVISCQVLKFIIWGFHAFYYASRLFREPQKLTKPEMPRSSENLTGMGAFLFGDLIVQIIITNFLYSVSKALEGRSRGESTKKVQ